MTWKSSDSIVLHIAILYSMWLRAVWKEGKKELEGVIPSAWLKGDTVLWPPGVEAETAIGEESVPTAK